MTTPITSAPPVQQLTNEELRRIIHACQSRAVSATNTAARIERYGGSDADIAAMYNAGASLQFIADSQGVTTRTVRTSLDRSNVERRRDGRRNNREMARAYERVRQLSIPKRDIATVRLDDLPHEDIAKLYQSGLSLRNVAAHQGTTLHLVQQSLEHSGVPRRDTKASTTTPVNDVPRRKLHGADNLLVHRADRCAQLRAHAKQCFNVVAQLERELAARICTVPPAPTPPPDAATPAHLLPSDPRADEGAQPETGRIGECMHPQCTNREASRSYCLTHSRNIAKYNHPDGLNASRRLPKPLREVWLSVEPLKAMRARHGGLRSMLSSSLTRREIGQYEVKLRRAIAAGRIRADVADEVAVNALKSDPTAIWGIEWEQAEDYYWPSDVDRGGQLSLV